MTQQSRAARTLRLASLTATATGALLAVGAGTASADVLPKDLESSLGTATEVTGGALKSAVDPALDLQLYPLANTGTDPLSNTVGTQVADFQPVTTGLLTGQLSEGANTRQLLGGLPLLGPALGG
ncbi:hypothetical protein [Streptomyces triticirhizae]|uniref:ATP-binding protein n=1 Tax=Streptomyces triticirhizae TaxID=2483353 RepID=A0A3M2LYM2_9ACTN|nr:hypothetical protein [Streptomyces triticirhizae]RMI40018.1 hypothetical protein EBN88_13530 [Streptomyces triticirhizae]